MNPLNRIICILIACTVIGCTPSALRMTQYEPVKAQNVTTLDDMLSRDSTISKQKPPNANRILMLGGDSLIAAVTLYELEDIFWLDIYFYNGTSLPYYLDPEQMVLMDASRLFFRRLEPHEAANIYMGQVTGIPAYQPKYTYDVQAATSGYLYSSGYYSEQTQATVTAKEDPYNKLGYSLGAAIIASANKKLTEMANTLYTIGLVKGASIPSTTTGYGGIYWLKRTDYISPIRLRIANTSYEVEFTRPKK